MPEINESGLVSDLQSIAGNSLRSVATYDKDGYDFHYLRSDVGGRVDELADDIHQNLVLEGIEKEYLEGLFAAGDLHCTLHRFEDLRAYHFVTGQFQGLFVGVDTGTDADTATIEATCREHVEA